MSGDRSGAQRYSLLSTSTAEEELFGDGRRDYRNSLSKRQPWKITSLLSLSLNIFLAGWILYSYYWTSFPGILHGTAATTRAFVDFTGYSSAEGDNSAAIQSLWDGMIADHGIVAIDRDWAKRQNLAPARTLPSDPSKGVYIIEAYHALHCVKSIRKAFYQLLDQGNNTVLDRLPEHYSHCYDVLKQSLICSAPDHLFAVSEAGKFGNGQTRQCRNWGALRDWASQHTPCIGDTRKNKVVQQDFCHGSDDGIQLVDR